MTGALSLAALVIKAAGPVEHYDTGFYHLQMVRWTNEYPAVPGLANLHGRLGFNSSADVLASDFDQFWFDGRSFHVMGLLQFTILLLFGMSGIAKLTAGDRSAAAILRCLCLVPILVQLEECAVSLSSDLPATVLLLYALILVAELLEKPDSGDAGQRLAVNSPTVHCYKTALLVLACAFAITVKLSAAPCFLLILLVWQWPRAGRRTEWAAVCALVAIMGPFVLRNVVLTGYVVYPFAALDLFHFDWKVPHDEVQGMQKLITGWAIAPNKNWQHVSEWGLLEKLRSWREWRYAELRPFVPWVWLGLIAWLGVVTFPSARTRLNRLSRLAVAAVLLCAFLLWATQAPEPRYFAGWIFAFALYPSACLLSDLAIGWMPADAFIPRVATFFLIGCSLWLTRTVGLKHFLTNELLHGRTERLWALSDAPAPQMHSTQTESGFVVFSPPGDQAWNAPLPNTPDHGFRMWLKPRTSTLAGGFRIDKPKRSDVRP
jgi:hypothetical protein